MSIHDISVAISPSLPTWPSDHSPVQVEPVSRIANGHRANVSRMILGTHTGTHVDPPLHFIPDGRSVDQLDLEVLIGPALVVDMTDHQIITVNDLEATVPAGVERLLLKTDNSMLWASNDEFVPDYVALTAESAQWLVNRGVKLLGTDYLSVEPYGHAHRGAHKVLLGAGTVIVEGLNLYDVQPGIYQLICLPLKIAQGDGAPARAVLIS